MSHRSPWYTETIRFLIPVSLGSLAGYSVDMTFAGFVAGLVCLLAMLYYNMSQFYQWADHKGASPYDGGLIGFGSDRLVRKEKKLRRKIARQKLELKSYQDGIESLSDGVLIIDRLGHITSFNEAAGLLFDFQHSDLGQHIKNLIRHPLFISYLEQHQFDQPLRLKTPQRALKFQISNFGGRQKIIIVRDITQEARVETMRQNFIADVSHELRTPLTVINGYVELLQDMDMSAPTEKALAHISTQGLRMQNLVNDLIELSKLESSNVSEAGEWFELDVLIHSIVDQLQSYGTADIVFDSGCSARVFGVEAQMKSIVTNLLTNAVKYGGDENVTITIKPESCGIRVIVIDQGEGIPEQHLPRLTERFYRVDESRESTKGGTGLGLAIVKHALEHHDSELRIESFLGQGSRFSFLLPESRVSCINEGQCR